MIKRKKVESSYCIQDICCQCSNKINAIKQLLNIQLWLLGGSRLDSDDQWNSGSGLEPELRLFCLLLVIMFAFSYFQYKIRSTDTSRVFELSCFHNPANSRFNRRRKEGPFYLSDKYSTFTYGLALWSFSQVSPYFCGLLRQTDLYKKKSGKTKSLLSQNDSGINFYDLSGECIKVIPSLFVVVSKQLKENSARLKMETPT